MKLFTMKVAWVGCFVRGICRSCRECQLPPPQPPWRI